MLLRKRLRLLVRLLMHPRLARNVWKLRRGWRRLPESPDYLPYAIDIEPNVRCNLKCEMCQVTTWSRRQPDLEPEALDRILDQFPTVVKVKLQGMGEPTMNRSYPELVHRARARGLFVQTTTNGTLLGKERGKVLLDSGIDQIYVSIDGATAATHEAIRAGSSFERTLENVRTMVQRRGASASPILEAWCVGQRANAPELPDLVRLVADLGLDRLTIQHDLTDWGKEEFRTRAGERNLASDLDHCIERAREVATELGLPFAVHTGNRFDLDRGERCPWPWTSTYVTAEGKISPCCFLADPDTLSLGDLNEKTFEEIWQDDPYRTFRRAHAAGTPPPACQQCYRGRCLSS